MLTNIRQLTQSKDLIWSWTMRTIRGRYQQSLLGWLWAVIQPAATVAIFTIVFSFFVPVDTGGTPYVIFSYVAMVPWTFFASALTDMSSSLVQNMVLVTKIYFPREALPIANMLARLLDFVVSAGLFIVLAFIYHIPVNLIGWLLIPVVLLTQIFLVLGLGFLSAALNVFTRDIDPLLRLAIQVLFYATPVIYPISMVPEKFRSIYYLNPMAGIIESYREILVNGGMPGNYFYFSMVISILLLFIGYWYFKKVEFQFADIV